MLSFRSVSPLLLGLVAGLLLSLFPHSSHAQDADSAPIGEGQDLFVVVSSASAQTQMMAMVLSNQAVAKGASVRVLLCDAGGELAVTGASFPGFGPQNRTAQDLLQNLMRQGATVEVCAIFLPGTDYTEADLLDGVGMARPSPVAEYMLQPGVRYFTF